jgi:hypothetical protein
VKVAKAIAALAIGLVGEALTLSMVPDKWRPMAEGVVLAGITYGVYKVPNKLDPPLPGNNLERP